MKRERSMTLLGWGLAAFFWLTFFAGRVLGVNVPLWLDAAAIVAGVLWLALEVRRWKKNK